MNDDTISRAAAIDTLRNINAIVSPISDDVLLIDKAEAMTKLMMLPPAQPPHSGRRVYMAGYAEGCIHQPR